MVPTGVVTASPMLSAMLWVTRRNSMSRSSTCSLSRGWTSLSSARSSSPCSARRPRANPRVKGVPYTGSRDLLEQVGEGADVVLVTVGQDDRANFFLVLEQVAKVGDHQVDPEQVVPGKHQACVDDEDGAAAADCHHVHAEFPKASKGYYFYNSYRRSHFFLRRKFSIARAAFRGSANFEIL